MINKRTRYARQVTVHTLIYCSLKHVLHREGPRVFLFLHNRQVICVTI